MDLYEYQARQLLEEQDIDVAEGGVRTEFT